MFFEFEDDCKLKVKQWKVGPQGLKQNEPSKGNGVDNWCYSL